MATLSFKKPNVKMFWHSAAPWAMRKSPSESPSRTMLSRWTNFSK